jgi:hypothetical protein
LSASPGCGGVGVFVVDFGQDYGIVLTVVFGEQGRNFAQFLGSLLKQLDLLTELTVLRLLATQNLMDIFHTSPCG